MRKIISLICILLPILAHADELTIRDNAPDRYTVVKGDTLWDLSAKFFSDPWKWPEIWGLNKDDIKDPHWIYPGDVIVLDRNAKRLHVGELPAEPKTEQVAQIPLVPAVSPSSELAGESPITDKNAIKLRPRIRVVEGADAISSIPLNIIAPFLKRPLIIESKEMKDAPAIIGSVEGRNLLSFGDTAFAKDLPVDQGSNWQIYRPSKALVDPDTNETLGYEVMYLGDASIQKFDKISTLSITKSVLDIQKGDHLVQASTGLASNYIPRVPPKEISGKIISIYDGVNQAGQNAVVTLNRGRLDGLDVGHVLALYKESEISKFKGDEYKLPALRYGLIFVFRTFDHVSYALVMEVQRPVQISDTFENP